MLWPKKYAIINSMRKNNLGFTLIELMTVIAIIGMLIAIILVSLNSAQAKAHDARRLSDFKNVHTGLEVFYDKYGKYPCGEAKTSLISYSDSRSDHFIDGCSGSGCPCGPQGLINSGILSKPVTDPSNTDNQYYIYEIDYLNGNQKYILYTKLEKNAGLMANDGGRCNNVYEVGSGTDTMIPSADGLKLLGGIACN